MEMARIKVNYSQIWEIAKFYYFYFISQIYKPRKDPPQLITLILHLIQFLCFFFPSKTDSNILPRVSQGRIWKECNFSANKYLILHLSKPEWYCYCLILYMHCVVIYVLDIFLFFFIKILFTISSMVSWQAPKTDEKLWCKCKFTAGLQHDMLMWNIFLTRKI